jgi:hypothetical protein
VPFDAQSLVFYGVPRSSAGTPLWRKLAWVCILTAGIFAFQLIGVMAIFLGWIMALVVVGTLVAAAIAMFITGPRDRRTTEKFILTTAGLARVSTEVRNGDRLDSILVKIDDCDAVRFDRTSAVWRRLRIGTSGSRGKLHQVRFDAGIRCPDEAADRVREALLLRMPRSQRSIHPPTTPQALAGSPNPPPLP